MRTFVIYTLINSGKGFWKRRSKQHKQRTGEQLISIWEHQLVSGPLFTNRRSYFMVRWTAHLRSNSLQRQNNWVASYQYNITCPSSHVLAIWCRNQWEWESTKFCRTLLSKNLVPAKEAETGKYNNLWICSTHLFSGLVQSNLERWRQSSRMRISNHLQTEQRHQRVLATNQERRRINDDIKTPEARLHADAERVEFLRYCTSKRGQN